MSVTPQEVAQALAVLDVAASDYVSVLARSGPAEANRLAVPLAQLLVARRELDEWRRTRDLHNLAAGVAARGAAARRSTKAARG